MSRFRKIKKLLTSGDKQLVQQGIEMALALEDAQIDQGLLEGVKITERTPSWRWGGVHYLYCRLGDRMIPLGNAELVRMLCRADEGLAIARDLRAALLNLELWLDHNAAADAVLDVSWLQRLPSLAKLRLTGGEPKDNPVRRRVTGLGAVKNLSGLRSLTLRGVDAPALAELATATELEGLSLEGCTNVDLGALERVPLRFLHLNDMPECESLGSVLPESLVELAVTGCPKLHDVAALSAVTSLRVLRLEQVAELEDMSPLAEAIAGGAPLAELILTGASRLADLGFLSAATTLEALDITGCAGVRSLEQLPKAPLRSLDIRDCAGLESLRSLPPGCVETRLDLRGCAALENLAGLERLTELTTLDLRGCHALTDIGALAGLSQLQVVCFWGTGLSPDDVSPALVACGTWAHSPLVDDLAERER